MKPIGPAGRIQYPFAFCAVLRVRDTLVDDPIRIESLKLSSALLIAINEELTSRSLEQNEAVKLLHITQPHVSTLKRRGGVNDFRLDTMEMNCIIEFPLSKAVEEDRQSNVCLEMVREIGFCLLDQARTTIISFVVIYSI